MPPGFSVLLMQWGPSLLPPHVWVPKGMATLLEIAKRKLLPLLHASLSPSQGTGSEYPNVDFPRSKLWTKFIRKAMPENSSRGEMKWGKKLKDTNVECLTRGIPLWTRSCRDLWETLENPFKRQKSWSADSLAAFSHWLMAALQILTCLQTQHWGETRHLKSFSSGDSGMSSARRIWVGVTQHMLKWPCAHLMYSLCSSLSYAGMYAFFSPPCT